MRIIAGKHKGRRIELGKDVGPDIRPTSEFAREAIFNILTHGKHGQNGHSFIDKDVLDICCGTGAFGLEALSRGAARVTFVDKTRDALNIARHNATRMNEIDQVDFILADAAKLGRAKKTYSLVFLDPPYFSKMIEPALKGLQEGGWIDKNTLIVAEHDAKEVIVLHDNFNVLDERRYGRASIKLVKLVG